VRAYLPALNTSEEKGLREVSVQKKKGGAFSSSGGGEREFFFRGGRGRRWKRVVGENALLSLYF